MVQLLLDRGADPNRANKNGEIPLHIAACWAAWYGYLDVVQHLLDRGANPNSRDRKGRTPLHEAVKVNQKDVVRLLLDRGADPNSRDRKGRSPSSEAHKKLKNGKGRVHIVNMMKRNARE